MKTIIALLFMASSAQAGVLINGNQINPASSISIGSVTASGTIRAGSFIGPLTGTATSFAVIPAQCSSGNYPLGIAANGDVRNCTAVPSAIGGSGTSGNLAGFTGTASLGNVPLLYNSTSLTLPSSSSTTFNGQILISSQVTDNAGGTWLGNGQINISSSSYMKFTAQAAITDDIPSCNIAGSTITFVSSGQRVRATWTGGELGIPANAATTIYMGVVMDGTWFPGGAGSHYQFHLATAADFALFSTPNFSITTPSAVAQGSHWFCIHTFSMASPEGNLACSDSHGAGCTFMVEDSR